MTSPEEEDVSTQVHDAVRVEELTVEQARHAFHLEACDALG